MGFTFSLQARTRLFGVVTAVAFVLVIGAPTHAYAIGPCPGTGPIQAGFEVACALMGTGDSHVPTSPGVPYIPDPVANANKLNNYLTNFAPVYASAVDIPDLPTSTPELLPVNGSLSTVSYLTGVPFHVQQTRYWCGPATTKQILDYTGGNPSQSTLADELQTTEVGTFFPNMVGVLNNRRPNQNGGPWRLDEVETHGSMISKLWWGEYHNIPGSFHVALTTAFFPYYEFDHDGHMTTSAGVEHVGNNKFSGGYVDPYDEDDPNVGITGGANTGGFHTNRIWRLFKASKANSGDMIW